LVAAGMLLFVVVLVVTTVRPPRAES